MSFIRIDQLEKNRILELYYQNSTIVQNEQVLLGAGRGLQSLTQNWDKHTWAQFGAIASYIIPFVGPALSLGFELLDAKFYYDEGDQVGTALALAFALIPMGELIKTIPGVKKFTRTQLKKIAEKASKAPLTPDEKSLVEEFFENGEPIKRLIRRNLFKQLIRKSFTTLSFKQKIRLIYLLMKTYRRWNILEFGITVGGGFYTFKKLFEIYGFLPPVKENKEEQNKVETTASPSQTDNQMISVIDQTFGELSERDEKFLETMNKILEEVNNEK